MLFSGDRQIPETDRGHRVSHRPCHEAGASQRRGRCPHPGQRSSATSQVPKQSAWRNAGGKTCRGHHEELCEFIQAEQSDHGSSFIYKSMLLYMLDSLSLICYCLPSEKL